VKLVSFDDHGPLSEDDAIIFREKPNPILYGIEAARVPLLFMVCLNIAQGLILHMTRGASIVFLVKLTLSLDCILFGLFIFVLMLIALGAEFILTDEDAIIRVGIYARYWSIPIEDVASVEVRTYGQQYGSVYLERCKAGRGEPRRRPINIKTGNASIWLSLPSSWPALVGFYGFRNFDAFANLIVGLRDGAQLRGDEGRGGFDAVARALFPDSTAGHRRA
jgi:hypothetical protein